MSQYTQTLTRGAGAGEVLTLPALPDVGAGGVVAAGSAVATIKLLAEDAREAVLTLAVEGPLQEVREEGGGANNILMLAQIAGLLRH